MFHVETQQLSLTPKGCGCTCTGSYNMQGVVYHLLSFVFVCGESMNKMLESKIFRIKNRQMS